LFTLLWGVPIAFIWDYFAHTDQSWFTPTIFGTRIFGQIPIEDLIWCFFYIYTVIIFYERFFHEKKHTLINPRMKYLAGPFLLLLVVFIAVLLNNDFVLRIPYTYLVFGLTILTFPGLLFLIYYPKFIKPFTIITAYFFPFTLLYELTALHLGQWSFPGTNFIGWVQIFGYRFPFEELWVIMIIGAYGLLAYYVYFNERVT